MPRAQHPHQKLPDKDDLEREYMAGASYAQLGEKYGVDKKVVYNCMVRRARAAGTTWPLKQRQPGWRQRAAKKHSVERHDSVTAVMVRLEVIEHLAKYRRTQRSLAQGAGISPSAITDIVRGRRPRIQRATATAIMAEIERHEKAERIRNAAIHAMQTRRARIAAEKAAGTRPLSQRDLRRSA